MTTRHYPKIIVSNRAKLSLFFANGLTLFKYFVTRKEAEDSLAWVGHEHGKTPQHTIEDIT